MPFLANIEIVDKPSQNNLRNRKVGTTANESKIFRQIGIFFRELPFFPPSPSVMLYFIVSKKYDKLSKMAWHRRKVL